MNTKFWKAIAAAFILIALLLIIAEFVYGFVYYASFVEGAGQGVQGFKVAGQDSYLQQRFFSDLIYKYPILLLQVIVMALILEKVSGAKNSPAKYGAAVGLLTVTPMIFFTLFSGFSEWKLVFIAVSYFLITSMVAFALGAIVFSKINTQEE